MKKNHIQRLLKSWLFLLFATAFVACGTKSEESDNETLGAPVKIVSPGKSNMVSYLQLNATTIFLKKEIVRAPFQGYIQRTSKNIGDAVNAGDVILLLQTKESYAINNSGDNNTASEKFSVSIKAKSSGVLTQLNFHAGDYVTEGDQIAVISNPNSLAATLNVPYQNSTEIKTGLNCVLLLPNGKKLNGRISKSIPSIDPASQTQSYLIDCGEIRNLPENLNLVCVIPVHTVVDATVLPKKCVLSNETLSKFWIMRLINDNTAVKVDVTKGSENDSLVQILNPKFDQSDKIISEGGYGLPDTAKVNVER